MVSNVLVDVQNLEYEALSEISKFCKENNIKFFLRGGSALGAVKYSGFVPWDDDIDIVLPRGDYNRLIELMPNEFDDKFLFVSYQHVKDAHCYFPRVILKDEIREKLGLPKNNERGLLMIDVLPLDGIPNGKFFLSMHIFKAYFYRVLASLWTLDVKDTVSMHDSKKQKILKILKASGIQHLYTQNGIYKKLDKLYSKYPYGKTEQCGILSSSKLKKENCPTSWWMQGSVKKFRQLDVLVAKQYDEYVGKLFGKNYMSYEPSVEERTKSHLTGVS